MFAILPAISLIFLSLLFQSIHQSWRESLLSALLVWGVILTAITELLSIFRALQFGWVTTLWLLTNFLIIGIYWRFYRNKTRNRKSLKIKELFNLPLFQTIFLSGVALIVMGIGVVAIVSAPNHSDSMEYHMSRIVHWIQNHSIAHYPTHTPFQLFQNPWSEFAMMHFQILSGGDRFVNLIQWSSMLGSLVGVSLIARQLGANVRGQILATVFCATIPMGILQGSSTNNDHVVALWLVCFAYFTLLTLQEGASLANICKLGASLGLAILTKGTAYIYAFPFCLWLAFWGIKNLRWQVWKPIVGVLLIFLAINLGHYTRNVLMFASPLGLSTQETNKEFSLVIFISNFTKNLALHADIVRNLGLQKIITPLTGIVNKLIQILHNFLGIDVSDPRTMSPKSPKFFVPGLSMNEDTAGNPLHLLLIFISVAVFFINRRIKNKFYLMGYFLALLAGFSLFCFLFTWSLPRCRLHLPLFILFSPFVGVVFSQSFNYRIANVCAALLIVLSHSWVLHNGSRPLLGSKSILTTSRTEHYFNTQPSLKRPYLNAVEFIESQNCSTVGLFFEGSSFEYPLWRLFQQEGKNVKIVHINVTNESAEKADDPPEGNLKPCAVLAVTRNPNQQEQELLDRDEIYHRTWSENWSDGKGVVQVFIQPSSIKN
ncbi:MAG: glycosyltransferase family 39 protein [Cyanobacteriota bacterium]|nr:glycosyltransferase family 39 protein [Cyanobacteriota bacterium]